MPAWASAEPWAAPAAFAQRCQAVIELSELSLDHADAAQRTEMIRHHRKRAPIERRGLLQISPAMKIRRQLEGARCGKLPVTFGYGDNRAHDGFPRYAVFAKPRPTLPASPGPLPGCRPWHGDQRSMSRANVIPEASRCPSQSVRCAQQMHVHVRASDAGAARRDGQRFLLHHRQYGSNRKLTLVTRLTIWPLSLRRSSPSFI